tara:strand:- start:624 stop:1454 length:831 start_codon:yes stop_codon:yes gene_type:complete
MKVFIQSNKFQSIAAKVAKYSFERFGCNAEIISVEKNEILKGKLNNKMLRNQKITKYKNDLQSFTLLRFLAPSLDRQNKLILVIDPDIFALKNPKDLFNEIENEEYDIACTFYNGLPRSEMMLINTKKINWNFKTIIEKLFNYDLDYADLMNLSFHKELKVKNINKKYNSHDIIEADTVLLHTTNRLTQPWKEGLKINFEKNNFSKYYKFKQYLKKLLKKEYDKDILYKSFQTHPDKNVISVIKNLFNEAKKNNYIKDLDIKIEIEKNNISEKIFE